MAIEKSLPVQAMVIAKHLQGESNSQIARDLEIARTTVIKILSQSEIDEFVERGRSGLYELIPQAVKTYGGGVAENVDRAESFLERMKVLPSKVTEANGNTINNFIGIGNLPRPNFGTKRSEAVPEQSETA